MNAPVSTRSFTEHLTLRERLRLLDKGALAAAVILFATGVVAIYSAGYGGRELFAYKQILWGGVAACAYVGTIWIGHERVLRYAYPLFWFVLLLLLVVLLVGIEAKGAQRWISFGFFRLQPSDVGKIALSAVLGKHLCRYPPKNLKNLCSGIALAGLLGGLVFLQPDLGSVVVYAFMTFVALFLAGTPGKYLGALIGGGMALLPLGWAFLKEYQKNRILVFLDPYVDPLGAGYNVIQSRIAVGAGGLFGKGYLQGSQSKLRFLPEPHTDFIFSVFAEETGFVGAVILLALFGFLLWRIAVAGARSKDLRCKVMVGTLAAGIWFHVFQCVAMSMGLVPVKGIPLPLFSYGGSSLLGQGIALGLVQSVFIHSTRPYEE
jgi:rod shape determining protein RodA